VALVPRPARFAAVEPKRHHNAPAPLLACALALANAPAMSIPAESAIEPKRSENMTVTWRRSALSMIWQEPRRRPRPLRLVSQTMWDLCNCAIGCPCNFGSDPTYGFCEGVLTWLIRQGHYGDINFTKDLAVVLISHWQGNVMEKNREFGTSQT
jgi:hypothetical protein